MPKGTDAVYMDAALGSNGPTSSIYFFSSRSWYEHEILYRSNDD